MRYSAVVFDDDGNIIGDRYFESGNLINPLSLQLPNFNIGIELFYGAGQGGDSIVNFGSLEFGMFSPDFLEGREIDSLTELLEKAYAVYKGKPIPKKEKKEIELLPMSLANVAFYLESIFRSEAFPGGISIAQDFGVHQHCRIDSNCTEAIKLRKVLSETNIDLDTMILEWSKISPNAGQIKLKEFRLPDISGKVKLDVAGQTIEVDLENSIREQLEHSLRYRLEDLRMAKADLAAFAREMNKVYLDSVRSARSVRVLPQINIFFGDLLKHRCIVSAIDKHTYGFLLPLDYHPQWIWTGGVRYKLHNKHIEKIRQEVYAIFPITVGKKFLSPYLVDIEGKKFFHYHGKERDCWGQLRMPETWDGTLQQLVDLNYRMQSALATINRDSLMLHNPADRDSKTKLPNVKTLQAKAKRVGKEDEIEKGARELIVNDGDIDTQDSRVWGEPQEVTIAEERR